MNDFIILADTRQQKDKHITDYFDKNNIEWQRATLSNCGDYMAIRYNKEKGIYKDFSILIDTKQNMEEIVHNLCNSSEHKRIVAEIENSFSLGCKKFYFIIADEKIKSNEDIKKWSSKRTKVKGEVLFKILKTFKEHHNCNFIICPKKKMAAKIIDLLTNY